MGYLHTNLRTRIETEMSTQEIQKIHKINILVRGLLTLESCLIDTPKNTTW